MSSPSSGSSTETPSHATWVLVGLIAVASVANLNLAVANVALPEIGVHFRCGQTELNLVSVGFSLGLAGSVLYLGALGDRYGRKMMLVLGMLLTVPTSMLAAWSPSVEVLILARLLGGIAAGMAFPTTLALITALWRGAARTRAIALWSAFGGSMVAFASLLAGWLLVHFWWGSVFLLTVPLALGALALAVVFVPSHVNENAESVDNLGGILSAIGVIALVLAINFAPSDGERLTALVAGVVAILALGGFFAVQRHAANPLFDLEYAARRPFWVAALAGLVVFGTLMGSMYVGEQFLQNVLGYSSLKAGAAVLPAAVAMILVAPHSARLVERVGSRATLLIGYACCLLAFLVMLATWTTSSTLLEVVVAFVLLGAGVGFAGTPASHSLTGSVPVTRAGMASGTADLQRDLGGSIMQSILGAILTAGYAAAVASKLRGSGATRQTASILERSYASAAVFAQSRPGPQASAIVHGAQQSFLKGANWAYAAGIVLILIGAGLVAFFFPAKERERELLASYAAADAALS